MFPSLDMSSVSEKMISCSDALTGRRAGPQDSAQAAAQQIGSRPHGPSLAEGGARTEAHFCWRCQRAALQAACGFYSRFHSVAFNVFGIG